VAVLSAPQVRSQLASKRETCSTLIRTLSAFANGTGRWGVPFVATVVCLHCASFTLISLTAPAGLLRSYCGEVMFHIGAVCFGMASGAVPALAESPWECAPAVAMALFFRCASVPMMEQRSLANRPDYRQLMQRVPSPLMLWPPPRAPAAATPRRAAKVATD
jgi:hypothetical protein